jgi:hypothetical protein
MQDTHPRPASPARQLDAYASGAEGPLNFTIVPVRHQAAPNINTLGLRGHLPHARVRARRPLLPPLKNLGAAAPAQAVPVGPGTTKYTGPRFGSLTSWNPSARPAQQGGGGCSPAGRPGVAPQRGVGRYHAPPQGAPPAPR